MFQLFVEGSGDTKSSQKLIYKITEHLKINGIHFSEGRRMPKLHTNEGLSKVVNLARLDKRTKGVLILRDDEDNCPKVYAPEAATFLRTLQAPFPIGYSIMYREFETLFVAYSQHFAGRSISHHVKGTLNFRNNIPTIADPETVRGAKEWISTYCLQDGRVYKPTIDQLSLTQALEIDKLIATNLPCVQTLVRCISSIVNNVGKSYVYPH